LCFADGPRYEFRGAWVTAWSNGFLTPEEADETIRLAKEANLNALFIQVRKVGDAYYKSSFEPRAKNIENLPDYDPLAYVIEKAHAEGLEVHAWLNTFRAWSAQELPTDPSHVVHQHPDWITRNASGETKASEGLYLDPGIPEVQDYIVNICMDIVKNYDVDGIHLDYIRYPGPEFGYAPAAIVAFNSEKYRSGTPSNSDLVWKQWRRDQVTKVVRKIYQQVNLHKPKVKVTAATIPWGDCSSSFSNTSPYVQVYQDWRAWMEEGILDANIPMNYKDESRPKNAQQYRNWIEGCRRWQYNRHVYCGLNFSQSVSMVLQQLDASRKREMNGMVGFAFNQSDARIKLVAALKYGIFAEPALVPEMPWKLDAVRRASRQRYADAIDAATRGRDLDGAIKLLHEALEFDPDYTDARFRLGRCYLRQDRFEEAIAEFEKVLAIDPSYASAARQMEIAKQEIKKRDASQNTTNTAPDDQDTVN